MFSFIPVVAVQYACSKPYWLCFSNTSFPRAITSPLNLLSFPIYELTSASSACSSGSTLLTSPCCRAYCAVIGSPKSSISLAFFSDVMERTNCTPGVEQKSPHLTPGVLNVDFQVARMRSQVSANCRPAAAATPLMTDRVTTGSPFSSSNVLVSSSNILCGYEEDLSSLRSCPEENTGPFPFNTNIYSQNVYFQLVSCNFTRHFFDCSMQFSDSFERKWVPLLFIRQGKKGCLLLATKLECHIGVGEIVESSFEQSAHNIISL